MSPLPRKIGAPDWSGISFIKQIHAKNAAAFKLNLPGDVIAQGGLYYVGIVASARVVVGQQGAVIKIAERDPHKTAEILDEFDKKIGKKVPTDFEIIVEGDFSFGKFVNSVNKGLGRKDSPFKGEMKLCYSFGKEKITSKPIPTLIGGTISNNVPGPDDGAEITPDPYDWFPLWPDCHGHWFSTPLKKQQRWYTVCYGTCTGSACSCDGHTTPSRICWGFCTCWC